MGKGVLVLLIVVAVVAGVKWKISSLEDKIQTLTMAKATMTFRNNMCQADIQGMQVSIDTQNHKVASLEKTNREMTIASHKSALKDITSPVEIETEVKEGSGPSAFDNFMEERFGE